MIAQGCKLVDCFRYALRSLPEGIPQGLFAMLAIGVCSQNRPVTLPRFLLSDHSRSRQVSNQSRPRRVREFKL
jgi:hypothetical protein